VALKKALGSFEKKLVGNVLVIATALNQVLLGYIPHDIVESHPLAVPIPLPPHEFIKVAGDLVCMAALRSSSAWS